ncbi:MAG: alpha/beta hydrolase-fold protein [Polyangiales bacterium]
MNPRSVMSFALSFSCVVAASGCAKTQPYLRYGTIYSRALGRPMEYAVYVPKNLAGSERFPLVLFLHGGGDGPDAFDKAQLGQALDAEVEAGRLPPFVLVLPDGELGFWENWYDGSYRYEDWVLDDLLPYVHGTLPVGHCPDDCAVMGVSMGGHGALRFALHHPEMFDAVAAISAPIFNTDQMIEFGDRFIAKFLFQSRRVFGPTDDRERIEKDDLYLRWSSPNDVEGRRLFFAWGSGDREGIILANEAFIRHLREGGIEYVAINYEGQHQWTDWKPVIIDLLRQILRPTQANAAVPP